MPSHQFSHMDSILAEMHEVTLFSKIELVSAYHQVLLTEESQDIAEFITQEGLFSFCRGLVHSISFCPQC